MRISDGSSVVCSSDLPADAPAPPGHAGARSGPAPGRRPRARRPRLAAPAGGEASRAGVGKEGLLSRYRSRLGSPFEDLTFFSDHEGFVLAGEDRKCVV